MSAVPVIPLPDSTAGDESGFFFTRLYCKDNTSTIYFSSHNKKNYSCPSHHLYTVGFDIPVSFIQAYLEPVGLAFLHS